MEDIFTAILKISEALGIGDRFVPYLALAIYFVIKLKPQNGYWPFFETPLKLILEMAREKGRYGHFLAPIWNPVSNYISLMLSGLMVLMGVALVHTFTLGAFIGIVLNPPYLILRLLFALSLIYLCMFVTKVFSNEFQESIYKIRNS